LEQCQLYEATGAAVSKSEYISLHAWRNDPLLRHLPDWNGSIIRTNSTVDDSIISTSGHYSYPVGPLTDSDFKKLESNASFSTPSANIGSNLMDGENKAAQSNVMYYFAKDGYVDPCDAVRTMRSEAMKFGDSSTVSFLWNCTVQQIQRKNPNENVYSVEYLKRCRAPDSALDDATTSTVSTIDADAIVIAAGIGASDIALGGLPMQQSTNFNGCTTQFVSNSDIPTKGNGLSLQRIVVDMVNETHVLQRRNGTVVAGGNTPLHVGGSNASIASLTAVCNTGKSSLEKSTISSKARNLIPNILETKKNERTFEAERPIPFDGFPSIGYYSANGWTETKSHTNESTCRIYSLVSHSGVTLAPLLGALAALEMLDDTLTLDLLKPYRPQRLYTNET
jgi:glycine/D-amino acid oxidase-like deaminating enzyme